MNCDETTELLSDRLKGLLSEEGERLLDAHLEACPACRAEAQAIATLWTEMDSLDDDVPHERMRARFHAALAAYEQSSRSTGLDRLLENFWPRRPAFQAALATALLAVGLVVGQVLPSSTDREIAGLRDEIRTVGLVLLDHQSAAERLRGIEWARRAGADAEVADALLEAVRHDPSLNVRLAAAGALSERLDRTQIGAGLTAAFEQQEAPLMQVTLAAILLEGNVDGSTEAVRRVLERDELDPNVRDYLRAVLVDAGAATPASEVL